ncbi:MAG TPA: hypothetical protein VD905_08540 [Flavobacteriales bacterium]|nr:hypothetical protein [Flavobacteriales bacterium]
MKPLVILFSLFFASVHVNAQSGKWIVGVSERATSSTSAFNTYGTNILNFWQIDFTSGTPVVTQRVMGSSITSTLSIGTNEPIHNAIGPDGNVAFYVFANARYPYNAGTPAITHGDDYLFVAYDSTTGKDEVFATVSLSSGGAASVKNVEIVPFEANPNKYFVIYKTACVNYQSPLFGRVVFQHL